MVAVHYARSFSAAKCAGANSDASFAFFFEGSRQGIQMRLTRLRRRIEVGKNTYGANAVLDALKRAFEATDPFRLPGKQLIGDRGKRVTVDVTANRFHRTYDDRSPPGASRGFARLICVSGPGRWAKCSLRFVVRTRCG